MFTNTNIFNFEYEQEIDHAGATCARCCRSVDSWSFCDINETILGRESNIPIKKQFSFLDNKKHYEEQKERMLSPNLFDRIEARRYVAIYERYFLNAD